MPEDVDSFFVLDYEIDCISCNEEERDLKIVKSTKMLLKNFLINPALFGKAIH